MFINLSILKTTFFQMNFFFEAASKSDRFFVGPNETVAFIKTNEVKTLFIQDAEKFYSYQLSNPTSGELLWFHTKGKISERDPIYFVSTRD